MPRPDEESRSGTIIFYNKERGFGFIRSGYFSSPLWFHYSYIDGGDSSRLYYQLSEGDEPPSIPVTFEVREDLKGVQAYNIRELSPFRDLEDFLKSSDSIGEMSRERFLKLVSLPAIDFVNKDANLTQFAVSRIIRDADVWARLTSLAAQWVRVISTLANRKLASDSELLSAFSANLARSLGFIPERGVELPPELLILRQSVLPPPSPLRCFRECDLLSLVWVIDIYALQQILKDQPDLVVSSRTHLRLVMLLQETIPNETKIRAPEGFDLVWISQRALIEQMMSPQEAQAIQIGRSLRNALPVSRLQPYEVGSAYKEAIFAGRSSERKRILDDEDSNFAVYGGRKIGKTWLLKDVCRRCLQEPYSSSYIAYYVSLQAAESVDDAASLIEEALLDALQLPASLYPRAIDRMRWTIMKARELSGKRRILLALDEIDDVLRCDISYSLFGKLRQLQNTYPDSFKFVFGGFKELIGAFADEKSNNPFANWVGKNHFHLGCLNQSEIRELIVTPLRWVGLDFDPDRIVSQVYELTSGHPYYTQSLCLSLVRARLRANGKSLSERHVDDVASQDYFDEILDVFADNLSPLQLLIGKVFCEHSEAFSLADIAGALKERFGIDIPPKQLREEMKILQACSVFSRAAGGYRPVMQRINTEFFRQQDDETLAIQYLEDQK